MLLVSVVRFGLGLHKAYDKALELQQRTLQEAEQSGQPHEDAMLACRPDVKAKQTQHPSGASCGHTLQSALVAALFGLTTAANMAFLLDTWQTECVTDRAGQYCFVSRTILPVANFSAGSGSCLVDTGPSAGEGNCTNIVTAPLSPPCRASTELCANGECQWVFWPIGTGYYSDRPSGLGEAAQLLSSGALSFWALTDRTSDNLGVLPASGSVVPAAELTDRPVSPGDLGPALLLPSSVSSELCVYFSEGSTNLGLNILKPSGDKVRNPIDQLSLWLWFPVAVKEGCKAIVMLFTWFTEQEAIQSTQVP